MYHCGHNTALQGHPNHPLYAPISSISFAFSPSSLLVFFSTATTLPSHSVQHSLSPKTPNSYHLCIACALLVLSSDSSHACDSCRSSNCASRGCSAIRAVEESEGGMGVSLIAFKRDALVWYDVAQELMMERISVVLNVVGISEVEGWKRSGYVAPMDQRQRG